MTVLTFARRSAKGVLNGTSSEVAARADFSEVRYAQCWEDADVLLEGLDVRPGETCVCVASAGDNALALLTRGPSRVVAVDLNPAQLACLELRVAAFQTLTHGELLELMGSRPSKRREDLYARCRPLLTPAVRRFWDARRAAIAGGIGAAGRFERYLTLFRRWVLPLVHGPRARRWWLEAHTPEERAAYYERVWNNRRWRLLFRLFFSRAVMGRLGRDPSFFRYVEGRVAERLMVRTRHALTVQDPAENPYLAWILTGRHPGALPLALRPEHFDTIRDRLDRLEWRAESLETFLEAQPAERFDRFALSDVFEYMSEENSARLLERVAVVGRRGGRVAYWNMLAPRSRPDHLADRLVPLSDLADTLHEQDHAFFYRAFVVEEIR